MAKLDKVVNKDVFDVEQYGSLPCDPERYKLYTVKTKAAAWDAAKPTLLVTGGVHGYEKSGVQGAILFLETAGTKYAEKFNIVCCPCVSPWGYECIQRWNPNAHDPNRGFHDETPVEECAAVRALIEKLGGADIFAVHTDLHETTDTDESEFRPAKSARDGEAFEAEGIPDGFYLVGDGTKKQDAFDKALIDSVKEVTHIAPADKDGHIVGLPPTQDGVVYVPSAAKLNLCMGVTNAKYVTTTEVYPDSPKANDDICNRAQVAAVSTALEFVLAN